VYEEAEEQEQEVVKVTESVKAKRQVAQPQVEKHSVPVTRA
jgi:hypothetical protein